MTPTVGVGIAAALVVFGVGAVAGIEYERGRDFTREHVPVKFDDAKLDCTVEFGDEVIFTDCAPIP